MYVTEKTGNADFHCFIEVLLIVGVVVVVASSRAVTLYLSVGGHTGAESGAPPRDNTPPDICLMCSFLASTILSLLLRLTDVNYYLKPRGPDYTGTASLGGFVYVHNLLHMTGQMTRQPFIATDNQTVALFNGEIYNYRSLQQILRPNGPPYTSDGECILEAYHQWGRTFSRHFEGEFAIAIFDLARRHILLTVDPFGVKPLFVAIEPNAFGVSSYKSGLLRAGHPERSITQLRPNSAYVYHYNSVAKATSSTGYGLPTQFTLGNFTEVAHSSLVKWDLRQHKTSGDDWEKAFEAAVQVRTAGAFRGVFLPLSSGYDSGAIHLAMVRLGVPHATYSIIGAENSMDVALIRQRLDFARKYQQQHRSSLAVGSDNAGSSGGDDGSDGSGSGIEVMRGGNASHLGSFIVRVNTSTYRKTYAALAERCEPYMYSEPNFADPKLDTPEFVVGAVLKTAHFPMLTDSAAMGVGHICSLAKARGQRVLLTGGGADETLTDYGFNGRRFSYKSQFGGRFPNDTALASFFPWANWYGGSQRNYLAKDEYVTGTFGVEGRFPFLDAKVVQEGLHITAELKNMYYKAAIQLYMAKHGYPHEPCVASEEHPFGQGSGCKKMGFLVPQRPRKASATSGCGGQACKSEIQVRAESTRNHTSPPHAQ